MRLQFVMSLILLTVNSLAGQEPLEGTGLQPTQVSDVDSFWAMAQLGGGIGYVILGVLACGLFLIFYKIINLVMDKRNSSALIGTVFQGMNADEVKSLANRSSNTILGSTIGHLIDFHQAGGQADSIHSELVFYMDQENEKFETYRNWLNFLSDSAGALGLLGTVWGVFLTFFGGNLDSEKILNGMGVALITTLLGLVVSLIINLFSTQIYGAFQRRLELVTRKADELRLYLLSQGQTTRRAPLRQTVAAETPAAQAATAQKPASNGKTNSRTIKLVKVRGSEMQAGQTIKGAIQLQVVDSSGKALPNSTLHLVSEGPVRFPKHGVRMESLTDKNGLAIVDLEAQEITGQGKVAVSLNGDSDSARRISFSVKPGEAEKLSESGGNDQSAPILSVLPEPFRLTVSDRFGNRVPNALVSFRVSMGSGTFQDGNDQVSVQSDASGVAEARLKLGEKTGFHTVEASLNGGRKSKLEFRVLSTGE